MHLHFILGSYLKPKWEILQGLGLIDILVLPSIIGIILMIAYLSIHNIPRDHLYRRYLFPALTANIGAGLVFAVIYNYYYQGGDTFWYYYLSDPFREAFRDNPLIGTRLFFAPVGTYADDTLPYTMKIWSVYFYRQDAETIFMSKLIGLVEAIFFPSYWFTTVLFSTFCFTGKWQMFKVFVKRYPQLHFQLALAILFVPSTLFWGAGILKDTICFGALGWCVYFIDRIIFHPGKNTLYLIPLLILGRIILLLKAYIVLSYIPAFVIWQYARYRPNPSGLLLKYTLSPLILAVVVVFSGVLVSNLASTSNKYDPDILEKRAEGFRTYHTYLAQKEGQSYYSLGRVEYTVAGVLRKAPEAINVTYFRPYFWEVNEPLQFISAFESLLMMLVFLYVIRKIGFWRMIRIARSNPDIIMCLTYAFLFGIVVGLTAYNFGALVRFKIPGIPFFLSALAITYGQGTGIIKNYHEALKQPAVDSG